MFQNYLSNFKTWKKTKQNKPQTTRCSYKLPNHSMIIQLLVEYIPVWYHCHGFCLLVPLPQPWFISAIFNILLTNFFQDLFHPVFS